jgi:hypothetical protein
MPIWFQALAIVVLAAVLAATAWWVESHDSRTANTVHLFIYIQMPVPIIFWAFASCGD